MELPENFKSTIVDFVRGLSVTFPEYTNLWSKWNNLEETAETEYKSLFDYFLTVYPERFFDIIYQNNEIFLKDSTINTFFLPGVDFKILYNCEGLSENSKKTIWKYLQLILLTISSSIKDKSDFGDTAKLFDCIDENELQDKLKDTMNGISDFFNKMGVDIDNLDENSTEPKSTTNEEGTNFTFNNPNGPNLPNLEQLHEQLKGLFDGQIGKLAKELAEEISGEFSNIFGESTNDVKSTGDVFKKIMKNPKKMMDLVKTIGDKIKLKMESGEISRDDLMREATDIMQKMKGMGGDENQFNDILKNLTKGMGMGSGMGSGMGNNKMNDIFKHLAKNMAKDMAKGPANNSKENKIEIKKPNTNFILEKSDSKKNNYVFKLPDEESQIRSNAPAYTDEELIAEFEKDKKENKNTSNPSKKTNKKKNKNKK